VRNKRRSLLNLLNDGEQNHFSDYYEPPMNGLVKGNSLSAFDIQGGLSWHVDDTSGLPARKCEYLEKPTLNNFDA